MGSEVDNLWNIWSCADLKHLKEQCESLKPNVLNASGRRGRVFESRHSDFWERHLKALYH